MKEKIYYKPRLWKKFVRFILDVLASVLVISSVLCSLVSNFLINPEAYRDCIITSEFDSEVIASVRDSVRASSSVAELNADAVVAAVGEDRLIAYSHEYTIAFLDSLFNGTDFEFKQFEANGLKAEIVRQMDNYDEVDVVTDKEIDELYEYTLKNIRTALTYIPNLILSLTPKLAGVFGVLKNLVKMEIPLYLISFAVITCNFLFGGKRHVFDVLFGTVSGIWVAACTVEVPLAMAAIYNIPSRLALSKTTFYYLIKGMTDTLITKSATVLGIMFSVITMALIAVCIVCVKVKMKRKNTEQSFYRAEFDEN